MKITDVEAIPVEIPVAPLEKPGGIAPYITSGHIHETAEDLSFEDALDRIPELRTTTDKLLVRLETDEGITGWGEVKVQGPKTGQMLIEEIIRPKAVGLSVWETESLVNAFDYTISTYYRNIDPFIGAVEIAMWDAFGKQLGKPVHQLLGGKQKDSIPIAFCLGVLSPEDSRQYAREAVEDGFDVLKTKASRYWKEDVERIRAMHDEVDGELEFRLDPNQVWNFENAVRVGAMLEDHGIYLQYLEQPIRVESFGTLKRMRNRLKTPIAVNEDTYLPHHLSHLASEDAVDVGVVDVVASGGIHGLKERVSVASDAGISLAHHSNFDLGIKNAAKLHVIATTPELNLPPDITYYSYEDYLLEDPIEIEDGRMVVPDEPGLAGEVDMDKVDEYRTDSKK